jgi:hypothetical protein
VATPGLRLGRTGLTVGAFATVELDKEDGGPATVALDSVNPLVLFEPFDFVRAFAEVEIGGLLTWQPGKGSLESAPDVALERLYGDVSGGDALNLRLGKFQTPVGIWNTVPAEPFTWTATSPAIVEAFDEHQTGVALFGTVYSGAANLEYWVYGQFLDALDPEGTPAERGVGTRVRLAGVRSDWAVGGSYLSSRREGLWSHLGALDAFWSRGPLELQAEAILVRGGEPGRRVGGGYLQGSWHLGAHTRALAGWHVVGRYERFQPPGDAPASHIGNLGLAWLPRSWLNLKADYQLVRSPGEHARSGAFASVSVIF